MKAADYKVSFGYGAKDGIYYGPKGKVGPYHKGNDRPTPLGTPIEVAGVLIGLTGVSGITSGPHIHIQAMKKGVDVNPTPYEFKPGTVVKTGYHPQFGNHVIIRVKNVDVIYAHLSKIKVKTGQKIEDSMFHGKSGKQWHELAVRRTRQAQAYQKLAQDLRKQLLAKGNLTAALENKVKKLAADSQLLDEAGGWLDKLFKRLFKRN